MAEKRRKFSREFKIEAVRLATSGDRTVAQVAGKLGIRADMLHKWEREARAKEAAFPGNGNLSAQDDELRRLRRELATVREERDILKKAYWYTVPGLRHVEDAAHRADAVYYAWRGREKSARAKADEILTFAIRIVHRESRQTFVLDVSFESRNKRMLRLEWLRSRVSLKIGAQKAQAPSSGRHRKLAGALALAIVAPQQVKHAEKGANRERSAFG